MTIIFRYTISPKIDSPIDAPVTDLRKKINISISSLTNITSNPSDKHVTNGVIPNPPISIPQPSENSRVKNMRVMLVLMLISVIRTCLMWLSKMILLSYKIFPIKRELWIIMLR